MKNVNEKTKFECVQIPDALNEIFASEAMSDISTASRERIKSNVATIEGSSPDSGMTCIAKDDYPQVTSKIRREVARGTLGPIRMYSGSNLDYTIPRTFEKKLQGFFRGLNKHCDECIRQDCENRVALSRRELAEVSRTSGYTNSRRSKVNRKKLPVLNDHGARDHI